MNLIKPEPLKIGDTIAIIAPSGPVDEGKVLAAKKYFEGKGFRVELGKHIFKRDRYLAGKDEERLEDLHNAFLTPEISAIVCARGGYGAIRLIDKIDYSIIKNNPKIFCGYSDITALSLMFLKEANLITYSAPMAQGDFGGDFHNEITETSFFKVLFGVNEKYLPKEEIKKGSAEGILWGGNLSTVVSLCGIDCSKSSFVPNEKFIFFVEDVGEPVYKIDKMFHQLLNIELFRENVSAIALGEFTDTDNELWLKELFCEIANELNVPVYSGYKFTHDNEKQTVPVGILASLTDGVITF